MIAQYIADGLCYAYTTDHQLTAYTNLLYITFNSHNTWLVTGWEFASEPSERSMRS